MPHPKKGDQSIGQIITYLPLVFKSLYFLCGIITSIIAYTLWFGKYVATTPYVDQKHDEALKYTDKQAANTLQAAFEHSDYNRQTMMVEIKSQGSDIKAMGAKQDVLLDSVRTIQQQMYDARRR